MAYLSVVMSLFAIVAMLIFGKKQFYGIARHWGKHILYVSGVKLEITGREYLNPDESYIFCVNHSSMVDIPVALSAFKHDFRIIYKRELRKIPVFGWCLGLSPYISIRRSNARDSMAGIDEAVETIKQGASLVIYPEGTRSYDGKLGKFKRGAFLLASRSGKKIVPVTFVGSPAVLPNKELLIRSGKIKVIISEPIEYQGTSKADEVKLMEEVHSIIENNLT